MPSKTELYFASPIWLQNLLVSAYGYRLNWLRYGRTQQRLLKELEGTEFASAEYISSLQLAQLQHALHHARATVPLYANRGIPQTIHSVDELEGIPVLQKGELQQERAFVTSRLFTGKLHEVHTGGTTGKPLTIYCTREVLSRNYAFFARFRRSVGTPVGVRAAVFAGRTIVSPGQVRPPFWRWNRPANTMLFSSYHIGHHTAAAYARRLAALAPQVIDSYPSALEPIARYLVQHPEISVRPRAVITSSETLFTEVRQLFEAAFGCDVYDHYGAAEMAALITQCRAGSYHVNPEFGLIEIIKDGKRVVPGDVGEIVATGFINPVMPLIRYATGDLATFREGKCQCGRHSPMIEQLVGRLDDVVTTPDGRIVGRLDPIFKAVSSIEEAQIIQDRSDRVRVQLVAVELNEQDSDRLKVELQMRLGPNMRIDIERVSEIPRTERGKLRTVVNLTRSSTSREVN
jgi:phenylacetate-CoA ligase